MIKTIKATIKRNENNTLDFSKVDINICGQENEEISVFLAPLVVILNDIRLSEKNRI